MNYINEDGKGKLKPLDFKVPVNVNQGKKRVYSLNKKSAKKGRYFHRITSGLTLATYKKKRVRFMTLTTSDRGRYLDISRDVDVVTKRIRRKYPNFQYLRVLTDEGNGVIHILFTGEYIPKKWIVANWNDIHESYICDISEVRDNKKMANYVVSHYLSNQKCSYTRMSWSKGWLFRGAIGKWKEICSAVKSQYYYNEVRCKYYKNRKEVPFKFILRQMVAMWNMLLYSHSFNQLDLRQYGLSMWDGVG